MPLQLFKGYGRDASILIGLRPLSFFQCRLSINTLIRPTKLFITRVFLFIIYTLEFINTEN